MNSRTFRIVRAGWWLWCSKDFRTRFKLRPPLLPFGLFQWGRRRKARAVLQGFQAELRELRKTRTIRVHARIHTLEHLEHTSLLLLRHYLL